MAETATTTATPKKRAPARRRPATRRPTASRTLPERAVLIPVGAVLEVRDRVAGAVEGLVTTTRSRSALEKQLRRFERRGGTVRKNLDLNVENLTTRVEKVVQNGVDAGMKLVNGVQERLPKVV
jgi:hypothetical protein